MSENPIIRRSPVRFAVPAIESERRDGWEVALAYADDGQGLRLADLSHCPRWDLQDGDLDGGDFAGLSIPPTPGDSRLAGGVLVNRMNPTQASVWHLGGRAVELPDSPAFTDLTEATAFLALFGSGLFRLTEQLTNLDLAAPGGPTPRFVQGPFSHVPCQIVVLSPERPRPGLLLTCSRGYARDMIASLLHAGEPEGLRPAGETAFRFWLEECGIEVRPLGTA